MLYLIRQYLLLARRSQFIRDTRTNIKQEANPNPSCEFSPGNCLPSSSREMKKKKMETLLEFQLLLVRMCGMKFCKLNNLRKQLQGVFQFTPVGIFRILSD